MRSVSGRLRCPQGQFKEDQDKIFSCTDVYHMTSTSFGTISHFVRSIMPPRTRRTMCSTWCPYSSDADCALAIRCCARFLFLFRVFRTYLDGKLFVVTGYCPGDFVLTLEERGGKWAWGSTAWGGKGTEPGKFQTAHGVTAFEGHIYVSNREAHAVNKFTPDGKLVEILPGIPVRTTFGGLGGGFLGGNRSLMKKDKSSEYHV